MFTMDGEFLAAMVLVALVLAGMTALVFVSRARIERLHRDGATPFRPRVRRDRRG